MLLVTCPIKCLCSDWIPRAKGFPTNFSVVSRTLQSQSLLFVFTSVLTIWEHPQLCYLQYLFSQVYRKMPEITSLYFNHHLNAGEI